MNIDNMFLKEVCEFLDKNNITYSYVKDYFEFAEGQPNWVYFGNERQFIGFVQMKLPDANLIPEIIEVIKSVPPHRATGFAYNGYIPEGNVLPEVPEDAGEEEDDEWDHESEE